MKLYETIESAYTLVSKKKELETQREEIESQISQLKEKEKELDTKIAEFDSQIDPYKTLILEEMKANNVNNIEVENIVAQIMSKDGFSWNNEEAILNYLKEKKLDNYITIKYSFKKPALKKAMESDSQLKEALAPYISEKSSEYLVITDKESFARMLQHIEENK